MPSHYSTIGFNVSSADELEQLARELRKTSVAIATACGTYHRWRSVSGAELWIQSDRNGELLGAHPHFSSDMRTPLLVDKRVKRPDQTTMDGAYSGWVNPAEDESIGMYPVVIDCPNFRVAAETPLPATGKVQIAAFAHELWAFDSPEHFDQAQNGEVRFASQSFVPSSALDDAAGAAEAFFCGHVLAAEARTNEVTGHPFNWARVETYGATFDVVCDPKLLSTMPTVGGVIKGTFWLSGYIDTIESRAGILKKLWWRVRNAG
jgi:hypothetical protein